MKHDEIFLSRIIINNKVNKLQRKSKKKSRMDIPETLPILGTQDTERRQTKQEHNTERRQTKQEHNTERRQTK